MNFRKRINNTLLPTPFRCFSFHAKGSFRFLYAFSLAKVGRLTAMPSTSHIFPISNKFCEAKAFSFGARHKTKSKFYPKFLGEGCHLPLIHKQGKGLKAKRSR